MICTKYAVRWKLKRVEWIQTWVLSYGGSWKPHAFTVKKDKMAQRVAGQSNPTIASARHCGAFGLIGVTVHITERSWHPVIFLRGSVRNIHPSPHHYNYVFSIILFPLQYNSFLRSQPLILPFYKSCLIATGVIFLKKWAFEHATFLNSVLLLQSPCGGAGSSSLNDPCLLYRSHFFLPFLFSHTWSGSSNDRYMYHNICQR